MIRKWARVIGRLGSGRWAGGRVCRSQEIYGGPRGVALWPTAAPHIIIISACAAQWDKEENWACAVKNGTEAPPSGTWHDAEGDIKGTKHWDPLA